MLTIGLTGGIGSGKTTVRQIVASLGVACFDLDAVSREVVLPGSKGLEGLVGLFGSAILNRDFTLDRQKLKAIIFSKALDKQRVESLLHPLIKTRAEQRIEKYRLEGETVCLIEIPLLTEIGKPSYIDQVWVCDCAVETQIQRVKTRDACKESYILNIINQQASRDERLSIANVVIDSEQTTKDIKHQIMQHLNKLIKFS